MRMKAGLFLMAALAIQPCLGAAPPDAAAYIAARGWTPYQQHRLLKMPVADVVPVTYFAKGETAPSCGLLFQGKGGPGFIEVLGPGPLGFPQCLSIDDAAAFTLNQRPYLVLEVVNRHSRKDIYRQFFFVQGNGAGLYAKDEALHAAVASMARMPGFKGKAGGAAEGVRLAKASYIRQSVPTMALLARDSFYSETGTYAVLENRAAGKCAFAFEKGGRVIKFEHTVFSDADSCTDILASSKFDKDGKTFFMTMFKGLKGKHLAIVSISNSNVVAAEKKLAALASAKASLTDMRSVRMFILSTMQ